MAPSIFAAAAATLLLPVVHGRGGASGVKGEEPSVDIHTTQISAQALSDGKQYETYEVRPPVLRRRQNGSSSESAGERLRCAAGAGGGQLRAAG